MSRHSSQSEEEPLDVADRPLGFAASLCSEADVEAFLVQRHHDRAENVTTGDADRANRQQRRRAQRPYQLFLRASQVSAAAAEAWVRHIHGIAPDEELRCQADVDQLVAFHDDQVRLLATPWNDGKTLVDLRELWLATERVAQSRPDHANEFVRLNCKALRRCDFDEWHRRRS